MCLSNATCTATLRYHDDSGENVFSMIGDLMKFEILYHFGRGAVCTT
jgi:hypothetical protein